MSKLVNKPAPNYRMFNVVQLNDALRKIDKDRFPDRVAAIEMYLENHRLGGKEIKDKRLNFSSNLNTVFQLFSIELVFWLFLAVLALLGFTIW